MEEKGQRVDIMEMEKESSDERMYHYKEWN
jgi:hypothetical protein